MILLTGTYNSMNAGDAAMQVVASNELQQRFPDHEVVISSPFPDIDTAFHDPTRVVMCNRRRALPLGLSLLASAAYWATGRRPAARRLLFSDELRATADADLVVDLSGDMLTEDSGVVVGFSHLFPIVLAFLLGTPFAVCAQSVGPFRRLRRPARYLLNRSEFITIREQETLRHLAPAGIDSTAFTADLAFLLPAHDTPPSITGGSSGEEGIIGVSISQILTSKYHEASGRSLVEDLASALEPHLVSHRVIIVAHVFGPTPAKDDRIPGRELQKRLGDRAMLVDQELRPEELKGVIATCNVFVGARMHANIAALSQGVPVLAMSYSHKTLGIMRMFSQEDMVISGASASPSELASHVETLVATEGQRREQLAEALPAVKRSAASNFDYIAAALDELPHTGSVPT